MQPDVEVSVLKGSSGSSFGGAPECNWPGGAPLGIYFAAATRDARALRLIEPRLRCEDNPAFFVKPTPWASIVACVHGLWTPAAERSIRAAKRTREIGFLQPQKLFPADPGVVRCAISAGGPPRPSGRRTISGLCGVSLTGPASKKLVHFVETWADGKHVFRHHWTIRGSTLMTQRGPTPPQRWI
jgi:hypothetical protein